MISESIKQLVQYGLDTGLVSKEDTIYVTNRIQEVLKETTYEEPESVPPADLETILGRLTDYAVSKGLLEHDSVVYRDLFDTQLMGCLTPPPSQVTASFVPFTRKARKKPQTISTNSARIPTTSGVTGFPKTSAGNTAALTENWTLPSTLSLIHI